MIRLALIVCVAAVALASIAAIAQQYPYGPGGGGAGLGACSISGCISSAFGPAHVAVASGPAPTPCGALQGDQTVACNAAMMPLLGL